VGLGDLEGSDVVLADGLSLNPWMGRSSDRRVNSENAF
jgi:hypothetical protein